MKNLTNFIQEKYLIDEGNQYTCHPKDKFELRKILEERLAEDKDADLNDIDVSKITNMGYNGFSNKKGLFEGLDPHNIDISEWDVSKVTDMRYMFNECENFTGKGLENWDVSKVTNMNHMFYKCKNFDADLSNWDISKVKNMKNIFFDCKKFIGKGLDNWNFSNCKDFHIYFLIAKNNQILKGLKIGMYQI